MLADVFFEALPNKPPLLSLDRARAGAGLREYWQSCAAHRDDRRWQGTTPCLFLSNYLIWIGISETTLSPFIRSVSQPARS